MSRYMILIILNAPLVVVGLLNSVAAYKLKRSGKRRFVFRVIFWLVVLAGLILIEPAYNFLFSNNLTQTEPLSLFDVIQITGIVFVFLIANQAYVRADLLEHRLEDLHKELSIRLSDNESKK